jgi:hypothetical protein
MVPEIKPSQGTWWNYHQCSLSELHPRSGLNMLTRRFVLVLVVVLVLERAYSHRLALQLCGSALSELHPRSGLQVLKGLRTYGCRSIVVGYRLEAYATLGRQSRLGVLPPKKRIRNSRFCLLYHRRNRVTLSPEPPGIFRFGLAPAGAGP